jgi:hypothetical protein
VRHNDDFVMVPRILEKEKEHSHCWLRNHVSESLPLSLSLSLPPRGKLPAPALSIERSNLLRPSGVTWWSYSENRRRNMKSYKSHKKKTRKFRKRDCSGGKK